MIMKGPIMSRPVSSQGFGIQLFISRFRSFIRHAFMNEQRADTARQNSRTTP